MATVTKHVYVYGFDSFFVSFRFGFSCCKFAFSMQNALMNFVADLGKY